jgi:hypothetical protein
MINWLIHPKAASPQSRSQLFLPRFDCRLLAVAQRSVQTEHNVTQAEWYVNVEKHEA